MDESQTYLGHAIRVTIKKRGAASFEWTYFIDATYCFQSRQCLPAERSARDDALAHAHRSIDRLIVMQPPTLHAMALPVRASVAPDPR